MGRETNPSEGTIGVLIVKKIQPLPAKGGGGWGGIDGPLNQARPRKKRKTHSSKGGTSTGKSVLRKKSGLEEGKVSSFLSVKQLLFEIKTYVRALGGPFTEGGGGGTGGDGKGRPSARGGGGGGGGGGGRGRAGPRCLEWE